MLFRCAWSTMAIAIAAATLCCSTTQAMVVAGDATLTAQAPADDPGWANVTISNSRVYIYLGDGWALSARHVGPATVNVGGPSQALAFSTGTYSLVPNQVYTVDNPDSMTQVFPTNPAPSATSHDTDLQLVRLSADPGLSSIFGPNPKFTLPTPDEAPPAAAQVVFIGHGASRVTDQSTWSGKQGYLTQGDDTKRWGTNNLASPFNYYNSGDQTPNAIFVAPQNPTSTSAIVALKTPDGITRDVMSMISEFNLPGGLPNEAQAVGGDSGTSVFYKTPSGDWKLVGIVNANYLFANQPNQSAYSGDLTSFTDLSFYRSEIMEIINAHKNYSIAGDINLDGVVSGNGSGPATTDDVSAFVSGWLYQQTTGDVNSWKKGDLNLDGKVDAADFSILRTALNPSGNGGTQLDLQTLIGGGSGHGGVPEPSTVVLALLGGALLAGRYIRRRMTAAR